MGLEFLFLLSLAVFLPLVSGAFAFVFWRKARAHRSVATTWARYAAATGARYEAPAGEWPSTSSPVVSGACAAGPFRLELLGTHGETRTQLTLRRDPVNLGELVLRPREGLVAERPAGFGASLNTFSFQRSFQAFALHPETELRYVRGAVELEWPGGEMSGARLDEAKALASDAAVSLCPTAKRTGT
jgi:hypothetical protein